MRNGHKFNAKENKTIAVGKNAEQLAVVSKNGQHRSTPKIERYFSQCLVLHFAPSNKSIEPKQITIIFICDCMCASAAPKIPTITFQLK